MKKILLIALFLSTSFIGFSQSGSFPGFPIYGTSAGSDRTYRDLQIGTTTITDTLGATVDTLQLIPGNVSGAGAVYHKDYILNLKDSCALVIAKLGSSYQFSTMTIYINAPSIGGAVYFCGYSLLSTKWSLTSAATHIFPTASHWYVLNLVQIGSVWAESSGSQD